MENTNENLRNHFHLGFESNGTKFLIDMMVKEDKKAIVEELGEKIAPEILNTNNYTKNYDIELVDVLKEYPKTKVFILTNKTHLQNHYLYSVWDNYIDKIGEINEYEKTLQEPIHKNLVFIDRSKPQVIGVEISMNTIREDKILEKIGGKIGQTVMNVEYGTVDEVRELGGWYNYAIMEKNHFIYHDTWIERFLIKHFSLYDEVEDTNEYIIPINWYYLFETAYYKIKALTDP